MKKGKILLIILFFILCIPCVASADSDDTTCADIRSKINDYQGVKNEYNSLVCDTVEDASTFQTCRDLVWKKSSYAEEILSLSDKNSSCNISEVEQIRAENADNCSNTLSSDIKEYSNTIMFDFYIIAPFLLIIFGSIDFFKIIVNGDPKTIQKNRSNFFKRLAAFVLLYFTPFIVNQMFSLIAYDVDNHSYICTVEQMSPISSNTKTSRVLYSGVYGIDNSIAYDSDSAGQIIKAADSVSKTWASQDYVYFDDSHSLRYGNIKDSINNSTKGTCCATLAAAVLYKANLVSEAEINSIPYNGAYYIAELLDRKNWQIIESYDQLKPGDIVFMTSSGGNAPVTLRNGRTYNQGHVQIYAGGTKWYNAGSTDAIQGSQPSTQSDSYARSRFSFALRPIATNRNRNNSSRRSTSSGKSTTTTTTTTNDTTSNTSKESSPSTTTTTTKDSTSKQNNTNTNTNTNSNTNSSSKGTTTKGTTKKK